jgi:hypothetical protein
VVLDESTATVIARLMRPLPPPIIPSPVLSDRSIPIDITPHDGTALSPPDWDVR